MSELHFFSPTEDCPHPELWSAPDGEASEYEVGEFLYGLVRLLKPENVVETGTYQGDASYQIGCALKLNKLGHLFTFETQLERFQKACQRVRGLPVTVFLSDMPEGLKCDLAFIDSGGDRLKEAKSLNLSPHGVVVVHDMRHRDQQGFKELGWKEVFFPTPRGISIFQR